MTINPDDLSPGAPWRPGNLDDDGENIWVLTEPQDDGTYSIVLQFNQDRTMALSPEEAVGYGLTLLAAGARAEYDVAVARQLTQKLKIRPRDALTQVQELRDSRSPLTSIRNMTVTSGVALDGKLEDMKVRAFVQVSLDDEALAQLDVQGARHHAQGVLEMVEVQKLDAGYRHALIHDIQVTDNIALQVVQDLGKFR